MVHVRADDTQIGALYLFKNGFQLPCIVGLSVCHHFFNLVTLIPEEVLSKETWHLISLGVRFFTDTIRLFPFTRWKKITLLKGVFNLQLACQYGAFWSSVLTRIYRPKGHKYCLMTMPLILNVNTCCMCTTVSIPPKAI